MRLCFVGDSFVNGTNDPQCLGWVGRVCAGLAATVADFTVYNLGVRRDTTALVAARWADECAARLPDGCDGRLVFSFGVNDCVAVEGRPAVEPDAALANARAILGGAVRRWPTLMVGPPPIACAATNARIHALSDRLADLCAALGVPYLAVFSPLAASAVWMAEVAADDGAHPRAAGYGLLAGLVSEWPAFAGLVSPPGCPRPPANPPGRG